MPRHFALALRIEPPPRGYYSPIEPRRPQPAPPPLTPELVVAAYTQGLFPMAASRHGKLHWYSADPRSILPLQPPDAFHIPHTVRRRLRRGEYLITLDTAFQQVIRACAAPRPYEDSTWINDQIIDTYTQLHHLGLAHSVEAWKPPTPETADAPPTLVGGLYGVSLGAAFFGESMFSSATDASKICLVHLVNHLRDKQFTLLDTQIANPHMKQFGIIEIPRDQYLQQLEAALKLPHRW